MIWFALASNLGKFLRWLVLGKSFKKWPLRPLKLNGAQWYHEIYGVQEHHLKKANGKSRLTVVEPAHRSEGFRRE